VPLTKAQRHKNRRSLYAVFTFHSVLCRRGALRYLAENRFDAGGGACQPSYRKDAPVLQAASASGYNLLKGRRP
jgi:hypothetical protein